MQKTMTIGIAVAFALVAFVAPASALIETSLEYKSDPVTFNSVDYVGGTHDVGVGAGTGLILCENIEGSGSPGIGGACAVAVDDPSGSVTITVSDDGPALTGFAWRCGADEGAATGEVDGDSTTINDFSGTCPDSEDVAVFVGLGGTSGTITVSS